jgi:hypothetical protein
VKGFPPHFERIESMADIKIFAMNESDWYAAETPDEALKEMALFLGFESTPDAVAEMRKEYGVEEPRELNAADLDRLKFCELDEDDMPDPEDPECCTFRQKLASMVSSGETFPCFFASTEF